MPGKKSNKAKKKQRERFKHLHPEGRKKFAIEKRQLKKLKDNK